MNTLRRLALAARGNQPVVVVGSFGRMSSTSPIDTTATPASDVNVTQIGT